MTATQTDISTLNNLLRTERAALAAYAYALDKVGSDADAAELIRMESEHREAVNLLRQHVIRFGGHPDATSGDSPQEIKTPASGVVDSSLLQTLKDSEQRDIVGYEEALNDGQLHADCKDLIVNFLLPWQQDHVRSLNNLLSAQGCCRA